MLFENRQQAGQMLAEELKKYRNKNVVVLALPRGGAIIGAEIAKVLNAPLDLIITRKIGHPQEPEYAIAATTEDGHVVLNPQEIENIDKQWFYKEAEKEKKEAIRRRKLYLGDKKSVPLEGKIAIIADDGIATGLTMEAAVEEVNHKRPEKIIVAVPVVPKETAEKLKEKADELIALDIPEEYAGAVGSYYESFPQITDEEVIEIMKSFEPTHRVWKAKLMKKIYSHELGIDLKSKKESEAFKWFLACLLFGKPIQQSVAKRTYFEFIKEGLVTPDAILDAGWERLVKVLGQGRYVRYDFSTASKLLEICMELKQKYGNILNLLEESPTPKDLSLNLQQFKGIGPVTTEIFLRDIKPVWYP